MKSIFCHKAKAAPPAANTLRFEFSNQSYSPVTAGVGSSGTWKRCEFMPGNVWDWTNSGNNWKDSFINAFKSDDNEVSVISAEITSVESVYSLFDGCTSLISVCSLDLSSTTSARAIFLNCSKLKTFKFNNSGNVTTFVNAFRGCKSLTNINIFDTSSAKNVSNMLSGCINIASGSLALYTQMSTQSMPPTTTTDCFKDCGSDTEEGRAELAQIPTSWGGTKEEI